jgi:hypothetical protein
MTFAMNLGRIGFIIPAMVAVGCAAHPFVRADPPVESGGVRVGLVDQKCDREIDPNWSYADILGLDLRVEVSNSTEGAISFDPAKVRLLADGEARKPHESDRSTTVLAGGSKIFEVRFLERDDNLACNVPMALGVAGAAMAGSSPLPLRPIEFLVSRDDI